MVDAEKETQLQLQHSTGIETSIATAKTSLEYNASGISNSSPRKGKENGCEDSEEMTTSSVERKSEAQTSGAQRLDGIVNEECCEGNPKSFRRGKCSSKSGLEESVAVTRIVAALKLLLKR